VKILTFDIGTGTKDVLLYDSERKLENCIKMVVPSPTVVNAGLFDTMTGDVYLEGEIVGGGPLVHAAMRYQKKGQGRVGFSPVAANAVKNDNVRVQEMGFHVGPNPGWKTINLDEHQLDRFFEFFQLFGETREGLDGLGLCVQDHGKAGAGETDRTFRFNTFIEHLERDPTLEVFSYTPETLPPYFMRMKGGIEYFQRHCPGKKIVVMDTCIAALRGCLAYKPVKGPVLVLNCGNSHSMAAILKDNKILALFEHHTKILKKDPQKYVHYLTGLADGTIDPNQVFDDEGEGAFVRETVGVEAIEAFLYTGPRRGLLEGLNFPFRCKPEIATPGGDMMMTGPVGLVDGYRKIYGLDLPLY
jgi:uncharacterized protein (DUF1786 family)